MNEAILTLATSIVGLVAYFVRQWITANIKPRQLQTVLDVARTVVAAAEKIGEEFGVDGKAKYDFAQQVLQSSSKKIGVKLTDGEAFAFIHAVLKEVDSLADLESYDFPAADPDAAV